MIRKGQVSVSAPAGYHRGMHLKGHLQAWIAILLILSMNTTYAMTLAPAPLEQLMEEAEFAVHGVIVAQRSEAVPGQPDQLRTRYLLWVWQHLKAPSPQAGVAASGWLEFVQPGGSSAHLTTRVPGVPTFKGGDEVVLLLVHTPWGLQPLGYPLGTFFITQRGAIEPTWHGHEPAALLRLFPPDFRGHIPPSAPGGIAP